ncbi:MAG TPA: hypothetical protein VFM85_03365 [Actinomycetota bacterium]|nr:hypothetical protein [Actinomycetota bacterium]
MAIRHKEGRVRASEEWVVQATPGHDRQLNGPRLTSEQVWSSLAKASFAIVGYVTPTGEPRSSGVVYKTLGGRLYAAVATRSWKARHIAPSSPVSVTVPVHRGGILALLMPIPPATVSFHGSAIVHQSVSPQVRSVLDKLVATLPAEQRASRCLVEIIPEGEFLTYGLRVPLRKTADPVAALARVPVS